VNSKRITRNDKQKASILVCRSLIVFSLLFTVLRFRLYADALLAENQSRFGVITGDVGLLSQGAREWIVPHEGLPIEVGDHIRTGEDGQVEIIVSQNALWMLRPGTDIVMEHTETNAGQLDISQGVLLGKVDSGRVAAAQHWEFNTPTAVCAVRGTEFAIDVPQKQESHLGVFEGNVEMRPAEGASGEFPPVRVPTGQEGVLQRGKTIKLLKKFSPVLQQPYKDRILVEEALARNQRTWSPYTHDVRQELRRRFVAPVEPPHHSVPPPAREQSHHESKS